MKHLKRDTIFNFFSKKGFQINKEKGWMLLVKNQYTPTKYIHINFAYNGAMIEATARWSEKPNVHIKTYWHYPKTMKDLNKIFSDIKQIYTQLSNCNFSHLD